MDLIKKTEKNIPKGKENDKSRAIVEALANQELELAHALVDAHIKHDFAADDEQKSTVHDAYEAQIVLIHPLDALQRHIILAVAHVVLWQHVVRKAHSPLEIVAIREEASRIDVVIEIRSKIIDKAKISHLENLHHVENHHGCHADYIACLDDLYLIDKVEHL